jgi:hypothetical protein
LLGELKPAWRERCKKEHGEILKENPFKADF